MLISRHGSTAHIYFYQRKCTHKNSYLIQHYCSKQPLTCAHYQKLGNACCRKPHFCIGRNSFPTFTLLNGMFPSPLILQAHNVFLVVCILISIFDAFQQYFISLFYHKIIIISKRIKTRKLSET